MKDILDAINRAYARPPLSWALWVFHRIKDAVAVPLRPLTRWHARRNEAELTDLAERLASIGMDNQAGQLTALADRYGQVARAGRHRASG